MTEITLIRHGQANSTARDERDYDRLSPLGHRQAAWLGDHLRDSLGHTPRLFCGTLTRHVETAAGMGYGEATRDARLNELEYFTLAQLLHAQHGVPVPADRESFIRHLPQVFTAWAENRIEGAPESFADFERRISDVLHEIAAGSGSALVVTSGGLIAVAMRRFLNLDMGATARLALAILNTSVHRLFPIGDQLSPTLFNAVPHLETPDRRFAQTHL